MTEYPPTTPVYGWELLQGDQPNDWRDIDDALLAVEATVAEADLALESLAGDVYTKSESDARYEPLDSAYTKAEADARYPQKTDADPYPAYATDADLAAHAAAADPHPGYLTAAEGDALFLTPAEGDLRYAALDHTHAWPTAAREYNFSTNTNTGVDPGIGFLRTNTGNLVTATVVTLDQITTNNFDIGIILRALQAGDVVFAQDKDDGSNWVRWQLTTAPTNLTGYWRLNATIQASAGAVTTAQLIAVVFYLEGGTGAGGGIASDPLFDAKGDLAAGTGPDAAARLAVGANGTFLTADSAQAAGLTWAANPVTAHTALPDAHHAKDHNHTAADGSGALSNEEHDGYSQYNNLGADPSTPATNRIRLYAKDNGSGIATLYYITENGQIYELPTLTSGGGGGSGAPSNASYVTLAAENKLSQETALGAGVVMAGTLAARPAAATAGRLYLATDAATVYRDSGSAWATFATSGTLASDPLADARGDLFAASAADTVGRLPVGTNGQVLTADSAQGLGVKWATPAAGGLADPTTVKGDLIARSGGDDPYRYLARPSSAVTGVSTDGNGYEFGYEFSCAAARLVTAIGWYRPSASGAGAVTPTALRLWDTTTSTAVLAVTTGIVDGGSIGWQFTDTTTLAFTLVAGRRYRVGYYKPGGGHFAAQATPGPTADADLTAYGQYYNLGSSGVYPGTGHATYFGCSVRLGSGAGTGSAPARLPAGVDGQVLVADSGQSLGLKWANVVTGAGVAAAAGDVRLANAGAVAWRNAGNTADLSLTMDASDRLALAVGSGSLTTSATGGSATALPSQPVGYLTVVINGTARKIGYYS